MSEAEHDPRDGSRATPGTPDQQDMEGQPGALTTGAPQVDAAVARLDELDALDLDQQVEVYDDIHRRLREALDSGGAESR